MKSKDHDNKSLKYLIERNKEEKNITRNNYGLIIGIFGILITIFKKIDNRN